LKKGKVYSINCYHEGCLLCFKTLKQRSLHHDKTEFECNNESVALINLTKIFNKTLVSISGLKGNTSELNYEENESLLKIKELHEEIVRKYKERGRENFCNLMGDLVSDKDKESQVIKKEKEREEIKFENFNEDGMISFA
jgi:sugar diacid utilization regulator